MEDQAQAGGKPETPKQDGRGGDRRAGAAANGSRIGRPPSAAKAAIAEAKKLTQQRQEDATAQAIAEADALGDGVTVASSAAVLEAELAVNARRVAKRLLEAAEGVVVQEATKDGPRIYSQPPSVPALIYVSNRIAGVPISKTELLDLAERLLATKTSSAVTTREDLLAELAGMILGLYRESKKQAQPVAAPQLEARGDVGQEATDGK